MGDTTKYQANFKTPGAGQYGKTLINVYADTAAEFSTQLEALLGDGDGPGLISLILDVEKLVDAGKTFGRYLDVDGDGIPFRTYPGTHPTKGSFFTRGTSRDRYARYTEEGPPYVDNMQRLHKGALQYLFDLQDETGVPMVGFGNPEVLDTISKVDQMFSRIGIKDEIVLPEFGSATKAERADVAAVTDGILQRMLPDWADTVRDLSLQVSWHRG